jgi:hypothetical protein
VGYLVVICADLVPEQPGNRRWRCRENQTDAEIEEKHGKGKL